MKKFDVAIIGGGSSGITAYHEVQKAGKTAILINNGVDGTTCARVGCMPSKAFIQAAQTFSQAMRSTKYGIENTQQLKINSKQLMKHVRELRDHFVGGVLGKIKKIGNDYLKGKAQFISAHQLEVNGEIIEAERIIIATGSHTNIPNEWKKFSSFFVTSDDFFELEELPQSIAVIGLGSIGLEIGLALSQLGVKVAGFSRSGFIGRLTDSHVNKAAQNIIEKEFPLFLNAKFEISSENNKLIVTCNHKKYEFDKAFIATGRKPNLNDLGLEKLSLPLNKKGIPLFNPQTMKIEGVPLFLAGDVTADKAVFPQAIDEGFIAGYNAARQAEQTFTRRCDLVITFTDPTISIVGKSFASLEKEDFVCGESHFETQGRALIMGKNEGIIRVYAETKTGKLLGAEMVCPGGEHLAHLLAFCIQPKLTALEAIKLPYYHPVIEEGLLTAFKDLLKKMNNQDKRMLS